MPAATFVQLHQRLSGFWEEQGCILAAPLDRPLRLGTLSPQTFLHLGGSDAWRVVQLLVNRCPREGRATRSPLRLSYRHQLQVYLRPPPGDPLELVRKSLRSAGFHLERRDLQFLRRQWTIDEIAVTGVAWRLRLEGLPVAHAFYPQTLHGEPLPPAVEVAYELERLVMIQHGEPEIDRLPWRDGVDYGQVVGTDRLELDRYYAESPPDQERGVAELDRCFAEAESSLELGLVRPAYDQFLRCCAVLEVLRARQNLGPLREQTWLERLADLSRRCLRTEEA